MVLDDILEEGGFSCTGLAGQEKTLIGIGHQVIGLFLTDIHLVNEHIIIHGLLHDSVIFHYLNCLIGQLFNSVFLLLRREEQGFDVIEPSKQVIAFEHGAIACVHQFFDLAVQLFCIHG